MQHKKLRAVMLAGILAALSFVLMRFTEFPLIPSASFLKTDLGDIPILIGAVYLGPFYGIGIAFTKDLLYLLSGGGGGGVLGAFINFIATGTFAFVCGAIAYKKKSMANVLTGLIAGMLAMTVVMFFVNMWAVPKFWFPKITHKDLMKYLIGINVPFNLAKGALDTLLTAIVFFSLRKRNKI
ncbi:MAG: ECF transporter S component [Caldisericaceae bacterium]|nr:ECF transporter S component [Caldisericaceae bacterium]